MHSETGDIRKELENRITAIQNEIGKFQEERGKIDKKLQDAESKLNALRVVYQIEAERWGERKAPLMPSVGKSYRFAGMRLIDALALIRKEEPRSDKRQALAILQKEGFDFRGKRPLPAVHFAWVALDRRKK
jgi:septal ring factor EnvC (AmiA/AmiB activator)